MTRPTRRQLAINGAAIAVIVVLLGVAGVMHSTAPVRPRQVSLSEFMTDVSSKKVVRAHLDDSTRRAVATLVGGPKVRAAYPEGYGTELTRALLDAGARIEAEPLVRTPLWQSVAGNAVPILLVLGIVLWYVKRRGQGIGAFQKGKGLAAEVPDTRFGDIAGVAETVEELREVVEYLHTPARFTAAGATVPRGFLLVGPPGTGKTLLARAVAGESGVPFFALSGSDFIETFVGVGAARVRKVFERARKCERAIIFIDEIDAIGKTRSAGPSSGANDERESTLNALLVEMDGFEQSNVIMLGATNRPDVLDPALTRPGRFDRQIAVPGPDRQGRTAILGLHAAGRDLGPDVDLIGLGRRTPGLSGADLAFLVNEAALEAARHDRTVISEQDFDAALATAVLGKERRSAVISDRDRRITAFHESGHALAALLLPDADDPVSVTIIPRGIAGGVTWMSGDDDAYMTRHQARSRLAVMLGGRAAEERLLDGDFTQGASGDLKAATDLATAMVTDYGMSSLGLASLSAERLSAGTTLDEVNTEVNRMLDRALSEARTLLEAHASLLTAVAGALLEEETLDVDDLRRIRAEVELATVVSGAEAVLAAEGAAAQG
ncbi:MAG: ATP-dependent zinc metalloprotease FtsH [Acidimicrobiales bacterium]